MKKVASLKYGVVFKKAFCDPEIFTAFVQDVIGLPVEIEHVETEKEFDPPVGYVKPRFDLFGEDIRHRMVVDIQHARTTDHYDRFLYYHCVALLQQVANAGKLFSSCCLMWDFLPKLTLGVCRYILATLESACEDAAALIEDRLNIYATSEVFSIDPEEFIRYMEYVVDSIRELIPQAECQKDDDDFLSDETQARVSKFKLSLLHLNRK